MKRIEKGRPSDTQNVTNCPFLYENPMRKINIFGFLINPDYEQGNPWWEKLNPIFIGAVAGVLLSIGRTFVVLGSVYLIGDTMINILSEYGIEIP